MFSYEKYIVKCERCGDEIGTEIIQYDDVEENDSSYEKINGYHGREGIFCWYCWEDIQKEKLAKLDEEDDEDEIDLSKSPFKQEK